jgi:hypothetical protein
MFENSVDWALNQNGHIAPCENLTTWSTLSALTSNLKSQQYFKRTSE